MESEKKFIMHIPFECSLIKCSSKDCGMKFVLHAILTLEKYEDTSGTVVMPQASTYFCPYCGTIIKGKKGK